MQIEDARKIVAVLMVTYPGYKPSSTEFAAKTWLSLTEEYTYEQVNMALKSYIKSDTSGFPPAPGQIIDRIYDMTIAPELNEMEAWSLVSEAIRNGIYNSVEEFAKLPPLVQKAVGMPGQLKVWALDEDYNDGVVSSNFIKCYKAVCSRVKEIRKVPEPVRMLIAQTYKGSFPAQMEQKRQETIGSTVARVIEEKKDVPGMSKRVLERLEKLKEDLKAEDT